MEKETAMTPIALAVAPLKQIAIDQAEQHARALVGRVLDDIAAHDWDLQLCAKYPSSWNISREQYMKAKGKYDLYRAFTSSANPSGCRSERDPELVKRNQVLIDRFINNTKEMAASQYESFVAKLEGKVGAHDSAELIGNSVWSYSIVRVTKSDSTENWKTQMIWKTSCLGKIHNQWPTRKVK